MPTLWHETKENVSPLFSNVTSSTQTSHFLPAMSLRIWHCHLSPYSSGFSSLLTASSSDACLPTWENFPHSAFLSNDINFHYSFNRLTPRKIIQDSMHICISQLLLNLPSPYRSYLQVLNACLISRAKLSSFQFTNSLAMQDLTAYTAFCSSCFALSHGINPNTHYGLSYQSWPEDEQSTSAGSTLGFSLPTRFTRF